MQLTKHIMSVRFFEPSGRMKVRKTVNCADINASRALGREIAEWLTLGVGYRVESETLEIERR